MESMYEEKQLQKQLTDAINHRHQPIEQFVTWGTHTDLIASHSEALELIKTLQTALAFYSDETKYYYAQKDHPNTRLAEDSGEIARGALRR